MGISLFSIILALILLMILVYLKVNVLIASILSSILVAGMSGMPLLGTMTGDYLSGMGGFLSGNFLIFASSALFAQIMQESGAAAAFAKLMCRIFEKRFGVYGCMLAIALMTYGGISVFVIMFAAYPILLAVFKEADLPRKYIPGVFYGSVATFASAMFPGTPQLNNIVPTQYLGTTASAAPVVGTICGLACMIMLVCYCEHLFRKARKNQWGFEDGNQNAKDITVDDKGMNGILAMIPMLLLITALNILKWNVIVATLLAIFSGLLLFWKYIPDKRKTINQGAMSCVNVVISIAAVVGFGTVVKGSSGFQFLITTLQNSAGNPLISLAVASSLIAGATGSGSAGTALSMQVIADKYLALGVQPQILHRIVTMSSVSFDSLPHNGGVVGLMDYSGYSYKEAYFPVFVTSVVFTTISLVLGVGLGMMMYPIG